MVMQTHLNILRALPVFLTLNMVVDIVTNRLERGNLPQFYYIVFKSL
jgi:hypothetical protein